jgi:hypothetical protein
LNGKNIEIDGKRISKRKVIYEYYHNITLRPKTYVIQKNRIEKDYSIDNLYVVDMYSKFFGVIKTNKCRYTSQYGKLYLKNNMKSKFFDTEQAAVIERNIYIMDKINEEDSHISSHLYSKYKINDLSKEYF